MTFRAHHVVLGLAALGALALPQCGPEFQPEGSSDDSAAAGGLDGEGGASTNGGSSHGGSVNGGGSGDTSGAAGAGDQGGADASGGQGTSGSGVGGDRGGTDSSGGQGGTDSGGQGGTAMGGMGGTATSGMGGSANGGDAGSGNMGGTGNMAGAPNGGSGNAGTAGGGNVTCSSSSFWDVTAGGYVIAAGVQVSACWQGYAFARSSGPATLITPTNFTACGSPCSLCASGMVGNSGGSAMVGFYLSQQVENPTPMPWTPISSGVSVFFTNNAGSPMQLVLEGEGGARWCYNLTGITHPVFVTWSTFNTECVGGTGAPYDFQPLISLQIVVPSVNSGSTPFNFCLDRANVSN